MKFEVGGYFYLTISVPVGFGDEYSKGVYLVESVEQGKQPKRSHESVWVKARSIDNDDKCIQFAIGSDVSKYCRLRNRERNLNELGI